MDRAAIGYAIVPLKQAFNLSNAQFGEVAASYGFGYMIMTLVGGILVDRFGARSIWALAALLWSVAAGAIGLSTGLSMLIIFRLCLGLAEGPAFPALTRAATDWLPANERARALAIGLAAVPFASVIGAPLSTTLIHYFNWRVMFIVLAGLGIVWALVWWLIFRNRPQDSQLLSAEERSYIEQNSSKQASVALIKTSWKFMCFNPVLLTNNYAFFAFGYLVFFGITWLPDYLQQTYHLSLIHTGLYLILPWLFASFAILFGGTLSDRIFSKTGSIRKARSLIIASFQALSALSFIPAILFHNEAIAMVSIALALGLGMLPNSCFYAINADLAPDRAATSLGIMDCFFALSGIVAPFITGWLISMTGNFKVAIGVMMALALSSSLLVWLFQHPDRYQR